MAWRNFLAGELATNQRGEGFRSRIRNIRPWIPIDRLVRDRSTYGEEKSHTCVIAWSTALISCPPFCKMPSDQTNWGETLASMTLVLLPGLDGTGNLFGNFASV